MAGRVLDYGNSLLGVAGLLITVVTFLKVRSVSRAQKEERALIRKLYGTDTLATQLRSAARFLRRDRELDARDLAEELVRLCGEIDGITKVLEAMNGVKSTGLVLRDRDYFTPAFVKRSVEESRHALDFLIYRNLQFANVDLLQAMELAAGSGVRIRILALSARADDAVLDQAVRVLPWPLAADRDMLREQLSASERRIAGIVSSWEREAQERFEYRGYNIAPNLHFLRSDAVIKYGFIGTLATAQPQQLHERPYVEIPVRSAPGGTLVRHYEQLWQLSAAGTLRMDRPGQ